MGRHLAIEDDDVTTGETFAQMIVGATIAQAHFPYIPVQGLGGRRGGIEAGKLPDHARDEAFQTCLAASWSWKFRKLQDPHCMNAPRPGISMRKPISPVSSARRIATGRGRVDAQCPLDDEALERDGGLARVQTLNANHRSAASHQLPLNLVHLLARAVQQHRVIGSGG